ncbi:MAG: AAA family ATPase [Chloroflexota bacterium]
MIPLKLQLRNFMSYRENIAPLLFDGFRLACLCGDNGHGKSALLDAITWALWGRARAKSEDELIHHGKTEMEVEFEFELNGTRYRVLRKRALKKAGDGVRGIGSLDLQTLGDGGYRGIAGNTMHETQRRLNELLRMEYDTFVNSAFILQGKADAFTLKTPADRKQVLADLLGLDAYDVLEDAARERARECESKRREETAKKSGMEAEAAKRPDFEAEALQVAAELATLAERLAVQEGKQAVLREEKRGLEHDATVLRELDGRLSRTREDLADSERQIAQHERRVAECKAVLARREEVEAGFARLVGLREQNEHLNAGLGQLARLQTQRGEVVRLVDAARHRLESDLRSLNDAVAELERRLGDVPRWQAELEKVHLRLAEFAQLEAQYEDKRASVQSLNYQIETLTVVNAKIKEDGKLLREKIELLGSDGARCPLCDSELGADGVDRLRRQLQGERLRLLHDYEQNAAAIKDLEAESKSDQAALTQLQAALREKDKTARRVGELEKSLADAAEARQRAEGKRAEAATLSERVERRDYAREEQSQVAVLDKAIADLGYDATTHESVKADLARYATYEPQRQRLEAAEATLTQERPLLEGARRLYERWRGDLAELEARRAELAGRLGRLAGVVAELATVEHDLNALVSRQAEARQRQGRVQQMINHCRYLEEQCVELGRTIARLLEEKGIYDELALAFGKKGIQAMIIETAVPELEDEANALLSRMTDGRMRVKFETQRAAKASDAVIETLDIRIADELGTRSYELFSGGEAFKVNFAIRIALSKLLARRAGARLEMLVVDEGFGTQDAQGRERLVEAINEVSKDFSKILVITHIEELKDAFPVRIDVLKTADGSQLSVS